MSEIKRAEFLSAFVWLHQKEKFYKAIADTFEVDQCTVSRAVKQFEETKTHEKDRNANIQTMANAIVQNPLTKANSARKLARKPQISRTSIRRIRKKGLELFSYKLKGCQELGPERIRKRLNLCQAIKKW